MTEYFDHAFFSLRNKNYRLYFLGQLVSLAGSWMQAVALGWLAYELTNSETQLGIILSLSTLPIIIFGLVGGYIGSRYDNYKIILKTQFIYGAMPLLISLIYFLGEINIWHLYMASLWVGLVRVVDQPARQSFMPTVVGKEHLKNAISLFGSISALARIVGPLLAGYCMHYFGAGICFLLNGVSFLVMYFLLKKMDQGLFHGITNEKKEKNVFESIKYIWHEKNVLYCLVIAFTLGTFVYIFQTIFPIFAKTIFSGNILVFSYMLTAFSSGSILGGLYGAGDSVLSSKKVTMYGVSVSIFFILQIISPNFYFFLGAIFCTGFFLILLTTNVNTILQTNTESKHMSTVMAFWTIGVMGMTSIGSIFAGSISELYGVKSAVFVCAVALFFVSMYFGGRLKVR